MSGNGPKYCQIAGFTGCNVLGILFSFWCCCARKRPKFWALGCIKSEEKEEGEKQEEGRKQEEAERRKKKEEKPTLFRAALLAPMDASSGHQACTSSNRQPRRYL